MTPVRQFSEIFPSTADPAAIGAFRGAIRMHWDRSGFRGFSGLHVDGRRLTAISDRGFWLEIMLIHRDGRLAGAEDPDLKRLRGPAGGKLKRSDRDAEALAPDGRGGFVVAFERRPRLLHYQAWRKPFSLAPAEAALPAALSAAPGNSGVEALARLCDGRLLALAQDAPPGDSDAWTKDGDGWTGWRYPRPGGFVPTGAATLPDCSVAVLERRGGGDDGEHFRVARLPPEAFRNPGAGPRTVERGLILGPVASRSLRFEAIASAPAGNGHVLLYLISDSAVRTGTTLAAFGVTLPGTRR